MELFYATTNQGKLQSLQKHFEGFPITIVHTPLIIYEPQSDDIEQISKEKATQAYKQLGKPVVTLDAGFTIDALNDWPGAYVKSTTERLGLKNILKLVEGYDRSCEFRHSLSYMDAQLKEPVSFTDHVRGTLAAEPRGTLKPHLWSNLGLIFIPEGMNRTLAELSGEEYHTWQPTAHRDHYADQFKRWLKEKRNSMIEPRKA